ncbi:MAG: hypothetical protein DHS20C16_37520 [Phycisphaerae bacterium]|nr:MAG: hypothetical protein DHS20C16_37520 [Phycisphaerae bacterium]
MKIARILELLVGVTFLVAAATKTYDMYGFKVQVRGYGVFPQNPDTELALAWTLTIIEAMFGAALIAGLHIRGMVLAATAALLVGFTALIAYGWAFHGLADCGCFGTTIQMPPGMSIVKNLILLAMTGYAWLKLHNADPETDRKLRSPALAAAGAGLAAVFAVGLLGDQPAEIDENRVVVELSAEESKDQPFAEFVFKKDDGSKLDLGAGTYVVAILNADCEHCQASVAPLNEVALTPNFPHVVALVYEQNEGDMDKFKAITSPQFETHKIDRDTLFKFVLGPAPPAFYLVVDGTNAGYLEAEALTVDDLLKLTERE